jgi:hypothetical protein
MPNAMRKIQKQVCSIFVSAAFLGMLFLAGCAARVRVYDPEYHDYHYWNHTEVGYYQQWEHDTHRQHVDFSKRSQDEQNQYWQWRHQHHDGH